MNVETTYKPAAAQPSYAGGGETSVGGFAGAGLPPRVASLTVREAAGGAASLAARRLDAAGEADALGTDGLDALIKSVLDFPPPPFPELR